MNLNKINNIQTKETYITFSDADASLPFITFCKNNEIRITPSTTLFNSDRSTDVLSDNQLIIILLTFSDNLQHFEIDDSRMHRNHYLGFFL